MLLEHIMYEREAKSRHAKQRKQYRKARQASKSEVNIFENWNQLRTFLQ